MLALAPVPVKLVHDNQKYRAKWRNEKTRSVSSKKLCLLACYLKVLNRTASTSRLYQAISEDPFSIYVECKAKERDVRIMVHEDVHRGGQSSYCTFLMCNQIRKQLLSAQPSPSCEVVSCGWGLATRPFC